MKAYNKSMNNFRFIYPSNYDGKVYEYNQETGAMRINPIPIIVELKHDDGKRLNKLKIRELKQYLIKDLKKAKFKFRNGDKYEVAHMMSPIATLLGVLYGLNKLFEKVK